MAQLENGVLENFGDPSEGSSIRMRSIALNGKIDEDMAGGVIRALMAYEVESVDAPITVFINTYGGEAYEAFAIYDIMKATKCPIITIGFGKIMSAGTLILAAGTQGQRYALPNTFFMTHDLQCGAIGSFMDVESQHEHNKEIRERYIRLLSTNTRIKLKDLRAMVTNEKYFSAETAKELGLIDHISIKKPVGFYRG